MRRAFLGLIAWIFVMGSAAAGERVDLELVLAVDISGSIDEDEARLQRQGYVAALTDPEVLKAIRSGLEGRIAIAYFEWSGPETRRLLLDWTVIEDDASAQAAAAKLAAFPIRSAMSTSISGAIEFAMPMFGRAYEGARRVLDISGDGPNNAGTLVTVPREVALQRGITINGLPIINDRPNRTGFPQFRDLDLYYQHCVIGGPGAFLIVAEGFDTFAEAIRKKMIIEIADLPQPAHRLARSGPIRRVSQGYPPGCDAGERQSREFWQRRYQSPY
ncbi:MAG: DUF1194 domain-containing protein [Alphaproteobacteria bacterium]|nr:DUF1194 domain-containing protein [Alphaproteobacteria bacterium]